MCRHEHITSLASCRCPKIVFVRHVVPCNTMQHKSFSNHGTQETKALHSVSRLPLTTVWGH